MPTVQNLNIFVFVYRNPKQEQTNFYYCHYIAKLKLNCHFNMSTRKEHVKLGTGQLQLLILQLLIDAKRYLKANSQRQLQKRNGNRFLNQYGSSQL